MPRDRPVDTREWERAKLAGRPDVDVDTLLDLVDDWSPMVKRAALRNPALPSPLLHAASRSLGWLANCAAGNPALPDDLAVELAGHAFAAVRQELAANHRVRFDLVAPLVRDADVYVRAEVASRPDASAAALAALADDSRTEVLVKVAGNAVTSDDTLAVLARCPYHDVADTVWRTSRLDMTAFRPSFVAVRAPAHYLKIRLAAPLPDVFDELAESWEGSVAALLDAVADSSAA